MSLSSPFITRRTLLTAAAALPLATGLSKVALASTETSAAAPKLAQSMTLGDMSLTTLLDASVSRENPKGAFAGQATDEEFEKISQENFISTEQVQFYFTPTVIDTGDERVLFDTGLGQGGLQKALAQAGVAPDSITKVVITHMHPDHIGGLMHDGGPTFANASYVTSDTEYDFWSKMDAGNRVGDMVAKLVTPLAEKMSFVSDGDQVAPGVTAVSAFGHTPGHTCFMLESGGRQLLLTADLANHYVWSFARPDWAFGFDVDAEQASASRRKVLSMLAAERMPMIGYHMPFPAAGFVETRGDGFRFVPVSYQLM